MTKSVWFQMYDDESVAALKETKSALIMQIVCEFRQAGTSQKAFAKRLGVSQPRLSNLLQGRMDLFSVDALLAISVKLKGADKFSTNFDPVSGKITVEIG